MNGLWIGIAAIATPLILAAWLYWHGPKGPVQR